MSRRVSLFVALAVAFTVCAPPSAPAKPKRAKKAHKRPRKKPAPAPTPDPVPAPVVTPEPATVPAPAPVEDPVPPPAAPAPVSAAPGAGAAPGASVPPLGAPPPGAPPAPGSLTMRPRAKAHGGFVDDLDCSACHTEAGWKLAPSAGTSGFDHDRTGFPLRGSHVQSQCSGCHTAKAKPATTCEGCHRDPHRGRHDGACAECHTATAWSDTSTLDQHRRTRMPLTGRHATTDCSSCHKRQGGNLYANTPTDCFSCHRDDYRRAASPHKHDGSEGPQPFSRECGRCHQTSAWTPAFTDPASITRATARTAQHDAVFVLSTGSHRTAECSSCHVDARRTQLVRCDGCHVDSSVRAQHRTPVARSASACLSCHPRGAAR